VDQEEDQRGESRNKGAEVNHFRVIRLHDKDGTRMVEKRCAATGYWHFLAYIAPMPSSFRNGSASQ
jgi:hypothetical protein